MQTVFLISSRFMVKHVADTLAKIPIQSVAINKAKSYGDLIFDNLKEKFPLILFSCVQLANKLFLHCHVSVLVQLTDNCQYFQIIKKDFT